MTYPIRTGIKSSPGFKYPADIAQISAIVTQLYQAVSEMARQEELVDRLLAVRASERRKSMLEMG